MDLQTNQNDSSSANTNTKCRSVTINREPTELCKILKFENLVMSGGESKHAISEGMVIVNGEIEKRKRRKIYAGDVIEFNGEKIQIYKKD